MKTTPAKKETATTRGGQQATPRPGAIAPGGGQRTQLAARAHLYISVRLREIAQPAFHYISYFLLFLDVCNVLVFPPPFEVLLFAKVQPNTNKVLEETRYTAPPFSACPPVSTK